GGGGISNRTGGRSRLFNYRLVYCRFAGIYLGFYLLAGRDRDGAYEFCHCARGRKTRASNIVAVAQKIICTLAGRFGAANVGARSSLLIWFSKINTPYLR